MMKKYIACVLISLLFCGIVFAQEKSSTTQAEKLQEEANDAYTNKEYAKAIPLYLKASGYPETAEGQAAILYNVSCCYSLSGNADSAFEYLEQSVRAGYTDYRWISNDPDFDFLRKTHSEKFKAVVTQAQAAEKNGILTKSPIAVLEYNNYSGPVDISKHVWDNFHHPKMDTLRERYQLYKIIENGKTEFDKMRLLLDWVANRWKHAEDNVAKDPNALSILEAAEKGERFRCVEYAIVLANCLTAVGYPARTVGLSRLGKAYGQGKGHMCAEVWSNQYQKWILLDGQNDAWWESDGMPLSAYECRQLFVNGKEDELQFIGQNKEADYASMKPAWDAYFYHLAYSYDNSFFQPPPRERESNLELVSNNVTPELYFQKSPDNRTITDTYEDIYPRLNQTKITLKHTNPEAPSDTFDVVLTHTMPYFDKFMVRINGSDWKESKDTFRWVLDKGHNIIEAKAVNLAGIEGKPSRIVLRDNIGTGDR